MCSLGIEPTTFALLTQCSTTESQEHIVIPVQTINQWKAYLFSFFIQNIDPYDWFCGPGSHIIFKS